jgi:hypothetical protein
VKTSIAYVFNLASHRNPDNLAFKSNNLQKISAGSAKSRAMLEAERPEVPSRRRTKRKKL